MWRTPAMSRTSSCLIRFQKQVKFCKTSRSSKIFTSHPMYAIRVKLRRNYTTKIVITRNCGAKSYLHRKVISGTNILLPMKKFFTCFQKTKESYEICSSVGHAFISTIFRVKSYPEYFLWKCWAVESNTGTMD